MAGSCLVGGGAARTLLWSGAFISGPGGAGKAAGSAMLPLRNTRTSPSADVPDRPGDEQIEDETEVASQYTDGLIGRKEQAGQAPRPRRRSGVGEDGRRRLGWLPAGGAWRLRLQLSRDSRGRRPRAEETGHARPPVDSQGGTACVSDAGDKVPRPQL